jgi:hypothetical protein
MEDPKPLVNPVAPTQTVPVQAVSSPPQGQDLSSVPVSVSPPLNSNGIENAVQNQVPIKPKTLPAIQPQEKKKQIRLGSTAKLTIRGIPSCPCAHAPAEAQVLIHA